MTAIAGTRSFYLDEFSDEIQPCDPSLEGWASWLAKGGDVDWKASVPSDGDTFTGSATLWHEDVVATRKGETWSLSRTPDDDDFLALRFGEGAGWSGDQIVNVGLDAERGVFLESDTGEAAVLRLLIANNQHCEDTEYIACGTHEVGWRFTFRADPARLEAEQVQ